MIGKKNQTSSIKEYLLAGNYLTSVEAFKKFGCTRLSAKIFDLRKQGLDIETCMVSGTTRYGTPCKYARYDIKCLTN